MEHGSVPIQDIVKALPRSNIEDMRTGVALYQTMLQLIDNADEKFILQDQERPPIESDLSGLLLRVSLFTTPEDTIVGRLSFQLD